MSAAPLNPIVRTCVALASVLLICAVPAPAQEIIGPTPTDARPAAPAGPDARPPGTVIDPETGLSVSGGINPLEVLGAAGDALNGRSGGADSDGRTRGDAEGLSTSINIVLLLTVITLAPSIMLMTTCFVRIIVVLGLLKQALGTQTLPPSQVIVGLSMMMTLLVMSPTLDRIHKEAIVPYRAGEIRTYDELWDRGKQPVRDFMFEQIDAQGNWSSVYMVLNYRGVDTSDPAKLTRADVDMASLIPAFMLSELKTAFLIGFRIYLPFLVIDMVISSLLISMGMMMLPPVLISLPFKLLLFVLVDGWQLVVGSLLTSFRTAPPSPAAEHAANFVLHVAPAFT